MLGKRTEIKNSLIVGSLNVRGIDKDYEKDTLIRDAMSYKMDVVILAETHISDEETQLDMKIKDENNRIHEYTLYSTNKGTVKTHGAGLLIRKELQPKITRISDRICKAEIQLKDHKVMVIAIYAHTLQKSEKYPTEREDFYETIEKIIDKIPARDVIILAGDFNAKTGSGYQEYSDHMGKFGKGLMNSSGRRLLELCRRNDLLITNTTFKHKKSHITTWIAPYRDFITRDGERRRNPVRNQIDYIITHIHIEDLSETLDRMEE